MTGRTTARLLALLLVLGSLALASPAATSSGPTEAARATADTTSARPAPRKVLRRNPLYRVGPMQSVGCAPASQVPLDSSANLLSYYESVLPCMDEAFRSRWTKLRKADVRFRPARLAIHGGTSSSPCGPPGPLSFYCGKNRTIYMYDAEIVTPWHAYPDAYSQGLTRLAATHVLAHEYGHHVQQLVGVMHAIGSRYSGRTERRAELQASCLGNVWLSAQRDAYPILEDYAQRPELWRYIHVSNHGSIANQAYWTDRGFAAADPGDCNTFTVPGSKVS